MERAVLVYFSPTHTTEKVVKEIASGLGLKTTVEYDVTITNKDPIHIEDGDIVIVGGPVYGGRLPSIARERLSQIIGSGQPAICVAVYGNNKYGDTLAELSDLMTQANLIPIAGASFIGEHSYANEQWQIANGRPNRDDLQIAKDFGLKVKSKLAHVENISTIQSIVLPGVIPREPAPVFPKAASVATSACIKCNICIEVCPVGAIDKNLICDDSKCIKCFACVKACPSNARELTSPRIREFSEFLSKLEEKSPEIFML